MKYLILGVLSLFSLSVLANAHNNWDKLTFDQQKQMMTQKLEKKSAMIQDSRTCVNESKDKASLKACRDEMKKEKQAME